MATLKLTGKGWQVTRQRDGTVKLELAQDLGGWTCRTQLTFEPSDPTSKVLLELLSEGRKTLVASHAQNQPPGAKRGLAGLGLDGED